MGIGDIALAREAATAEPSPVRRVRLPLLVAGALVAVCARAQPAPPPPAPAAKDVADVEVLVTTPREPTPLSRTPAAISVVDVRRELPARAGATLDEPFEFVPGVVARGANNFAQDLRLSVRGFGARAAFGIRGVTLLVDGFPETLPDGQSQVDSIDAFSIRRIEVMRGLASSLYGNAAGGVVRIETARPTTDPEVQLRASGGAYGLGILNGLATGHAGIVGYALTLSTQRLDAWRRHAASEQTIANANVTAPLARGELLVSFAFAYAPVADDPGGLNAAEVAADRRQASPQSLRFDAGEWLRHGRLGASWRGALTRDQTLELLAWGARRNLDDSIPFTVIGLERTAGGAGARWSWRHGIGAADARLGLGADLQTQRDRRDNFANEGGSPVGDPTLAQDETVDATGLSAQEEVTLGGTFTIVGGARIDLSRYSAHDRLLSDGDASGARTFRQPTGRLGAIWTPSRALSIYASGSQAFEAPTTTELVDLSRGGFNPDLKPQRANEAELGARGRVAIATWDVAVYAARIRDGLVRQEDANGRAYYVNASRSTHRGAEASVALRLPAGLGVRGTYTLVDARFDAYAPRGTDLAGERVPGIPLHSGAAEVSWRRPGWPFAAVELRTGGGWHADDENQVYEPIAWVLDARAEWPISAGRATLTPYLAAENATSARYSDSLRINAAGGRYFEPAPPLQLRGGISVAIR